MEMILLVALVSYLLGSLSFARIISRLVAPDKDVTNIHFSPSSTNEVGHRLESVSATTASVILGPRVGCAIGLLDVLKAFIPALVARLWLGPYAAMIAAIASMVGHNWPVYYRFKGGRGMSTFVGGLLAIDPLGALVTNLAGLFLGMVVLRDVTVAYLSGLVLVIPWMWLRTNDVWYVLYAVAINALFAISMIPDIRQIVENRRSEKFKQASQEERMQNALEIMPMGRGMLRMMQMIGRAPRKPKSGQMDDGGQG